MKVDEFLLYKTKQCENHLTCANMPMLKSGDKPFTSKELICPYYHSLVDERRPVYSADNTDIVNLVYTPVPCDSKFCMIDDCSLSNNFFELMFHPIKYKSLPCKKQSLPGACTAEKYCPYYHSSQEKNAWNRMLSKYFNMRIAGSNDASERSDKAEGDVECDDLSDIPVSSSRLGQSKQQSTRSTNEEAQTAKPKRTYITVDAKFQKTSQFKSPSSLNGFSLTALLPSTFRDLAREANINRLLDSEMSATAGSLEDYRELYNPTNVFATNC